MDWKNLFGAFDLDHDFVIHYQIHSVSAINMSTLVLDRQWHFALVGNALKVKLAAKTRYVCGLQEPRAESLVYFDCGTDQPVSSRILLTFVFG